MEPENAPDRSKRNLFSLDIILWWIATKQSKKWYDLIET